MVVWHAIIEMVFGEERKMKFDLLKNWRILLMIFFVLISIYAINPIAQSGVRVESVSKNSSFYDVVNVGEYITWANEEEINTPEDFYQFEDFTGNFRFMHSGKLDIVSINEPGLGIEVSKPSLTNLNFGLDLIGGTRVLLKPKENVTDATMQQIVGTLETRINVFGLKEAKFQRINDVTGEKYVQIEMAGGSIEEVENLLAKQGKFEGKIPRVVSFINNTGTLALDEEHDLEFLNNILKIDGLTLEENETSELEEIDFQVINLTEKNVTLLFTVFTGSDIQSVCLQEQTGICISRIMQQSGGWEFNFQVFITEGGAEKFAKVTKTMKVITDPNSGTNYLENRIIFYLDEKVITDLTISADLKGKELTSPAITGFRETRKEAFDEQLFLKSILQSGSLPVSLETIKIDEISPTLGSEFFREAILAAVIAGVSVMAVIFIRYRKFKILIQMMIWSICELIITLGFAAGLGWTIDLASIAGLIAAIGTGTNDQVIMIDEILLGGKGKETYTVKQRIKRSFFIVFSAAGTIVAAMIPLMFIGIGAMRGFAIITTIGVLIGVFITRPAFPIVARKLLIKEEY
jgi:preprotein translocase subunit SecD